MERSLGHRAPLLWLLVPWMLGLALGRELAPGTNVWLLAALALGGLGVAAFAVLRRGEGRGAWWWGGGLAVALSAAGVLYFQHRENHLAVWERLPPREAELTLRVERVFPATAGRDGVSGLAVIETAPSLVGELRGQRVFFSLRGGDRASVVRSAMVRAEGVIAPLPRHPDGGFDAYLASCGAAFKFSRGRLLAPVAPPAAFFVFCENAAARFETILGRGLDGQPALRSVLVAMLLGKKAELSEEQQAVFMQSGTMHLFAISGLHVAVIWAALAALLTLARVPRWPALVVGLAALWLYVQITGAAPSAMRSFIMIAFVLAGRGLRWPNNAVASIAAAALFTLVLDPFQLFGAGFQMSYAVVAALLWYGLTLEERWQAKWKPWRDLPEPAWRRWQRGVRWLGQQLISGVALCIAATAINAPTCIELFGLFTPGALLANLVLIPLGSLTLCAGLASLLAGLVGLTPLCVLFNHAAILVIWVMERIAGAGVRMPAAFWPAQFRADWMGPAALVLLLGVMAWGYARGWTKRTGGMWTPVALLVLLLVFGVRHGAAGGASASRALPVPRTTANASPP